MIPGDSETSYILHTNKQVTNKSHDTLNYTIIDMFSLIVSFRLYCIQHINLQDYIHHDNHFTIILRLLLLLGINQRFNQLNPYKSQSQTHTNLFKEIFETNTKYLSVMLNKPRLTYVCAMAPRCRYIW